MISPCPIVIRGEVDDDDLPGDAVQRISDASARGTVALLGPGATHDDLLALFAAGLDRGAPVLDFAGACPERADAGAEVLAPNAVRRALAAVAPMVQRLRTLPAHQDPGDRDALGVLSWLLARDSELAPRWDSGTREALRYPQLPGLAGARELLATMAAEDLLRGRHVARTGICPACGSARLNAAEHCPQCASAWLHEERLVHHYRCGFQAPEARFGERGAMQCPKCGRGLHHFGVDYDMPGAVTVCRACGAVADPPQVRFTCLDCAVATPSEHADQRDWFAYRLSEAGQEALRAGHRPHVSIERLFASVKQSRSLLDFATILLHAVSVAERYDRPLSFVRAELANAMTLAGGYGRREVDEALRLFVDLTGENLRQTDLLAVRGDTVLVAMPETDREAARGVMRRIDRQVSSKIAIPFEFEMEISDLEAARMLLEELAAVP